MSLEKEVENSVDGSSRQRGNFNTNGEKKQDSLKQIEIESSKALVRKEILENDTSHDISKAKPGLKRNLHFCRVLLEDILFILR